MRIFAVFFCFILGISAQAEELMEATISDSNEVTLASLEDDVDDQIPVSEQAEEESFPVNTTQEPPKANGSSLLQDLLDEELDGKKPHHYQKVVLNILDKVAGKSVELHFPIEKPQRFGTLLITATICEDAADLGEQRSWMHILDNRVGRPNTPFFTGWMFSDSPSLSALEHPEYDVTLVKCE